MSPSRALMLAIALLSLGGLGGSFQPTRLVLLVFLLPTVHLLIFRCMQLHRTDFITMAGLGIIASLGVLSLAWTPTPAAGLNRMSVVLIGMTSAIYVAATPKTIEAARQVRDAWSAALALTMPLAVYELATDNHFTYAFDERFVGGDFGALPFASVFFGNFNDYCTFIALTLPMALGSLESARHRGVRLLWGATIVLALVVLVVNLNRLALIFAAWVGLYYLGTRQSLRRVALVLAAIAFIGLGLGMFGEQADTLVAYAVLKFSSLAADDESAGQRLALIAAGVQSLFLSAGMGLGVGSLETFLQRQHPELIPNPHNLMIELAANFGLPSALVFVVLLVYLYIRALMSRLVADLRSPVIVSLPFVPIIGAIGSQAIGYTYWWLWLGTMALFVGVGSAADRCGRHAARTVPDPQSLPRDRLIEQ
ncbi:MAG: hypothetical protein H3C59_09190 [Burkholderiaceae bacterium]|nr:hypothetical protein [Burkholderiaceae bacterium]